MLYEAGFAVLSEEERGERGRMAKWRLHTLSSSIRLTVRRMRRSACHGVCNSVVPGQQWCSDGGDGCKFTHRKRATQRCSAGGAQRNGHPIIAGSMERLEDAIIAVNARPPATFRPAQYRSMGATALDIASVAAVGGFHGTIDFDEDRIGVWDYLAAITIVREAGWRCCRCARPGSNHARPQRASSAGYGCFARVARRTACGRAEQLIASRGAICFRFGLCTAGRLWLAPAPIQSWKVLVLRWRIA